MATQEDAQDAATFRAFDARLEAIGKEAALADFLPIELADRLFAGEAPVRVWREHRGLTLRALAEKADVAPSDLSEIENGQKPGSVAALVRLARALGVTVEDLVAETV